MPLQFAMPERLTRSRRAVLSILLVCLGMVLCFNPSATAQQVQQLNREYEIKAGYFAYFGNLITWPKQPFPGADAEFVVGILGDNPFRPYLRQLGNHYVLNAGRVNASEIQGKPIRVVEYNSVADFNRNYSPCHILFISRSSGIGVQGESVETRVQAALNKAKGQPVLLVADQTNVDASLRIARSGVMVCYWNDMQSNQVKMFINRAAEKRERLKISSRLLRLRLVQLL